MQAEAETLSQSDGRIEVAVGAEARKWSIATRIGFRFAFAYLVIYNIDAWNGLVPYTQYPFLKYDALWNAAVPWVGKHVLHLSYPITVLPNGSGDTTYNYVQLLCFVVLAVVAATIWSLVDRARVNYETLHQWLRVYVRFALAYTLISYGAFKVIKAQFPDPSLDRLLQPFGDASPMGLLWTFMGYSKTYNVFTGAVEMLGGVLLISRRTTTLGALVSIGAMANVFMLNMSYDVPVKQFSFNLLLMGVFLTLPDIKRLADMFVLNRRVEPARITPLFSRRWMSRASLALCTVLSLWVIGQALYISHRQWKFFAEAAHKSPLFGIWLVQDFTVNGQAHPPLITDEERWQRVVFDYPTVLSIQLMDGSRQRCLLNMDTAKETLALTNRDDKNWKADLSYQKPDADTLTIQGNFGGQAVSAKLHRTDASKFLLTNRGFHWINETPFNR